MNQLQELIQKLCPNGVQFKNLKDVCTFNDGYSLKAKDIKNEGIYIVIKIGNIKNGKTLKLTDFLSELPPNIRNGQILKGGEILVAMSGSTGKTGYNTLSNAVVNQRIAILRNNKTVLNNFLRHILVNENFEKYCWKKGNGPQNNISKSDILNYIIPVPPLEVQNEIVRILDTFTSHTAELQAELQARKEQYEYYRNKLLSFDRNDENVKWMRLGEIGTFTRGNGLQKKDFVKTGIGCIHYGQIYTHYGTSTYTTKSFVTYELSKKLTKVQKGNLIIACTSENVEDVCKAVAWLGEEDIVTGGHSCVFAHHENPMYVSYFFQTEHFFQQKRKYAKGAKVIDIKKSDLEKIIIPIPSLSEQQRIVSILDKFETLVNDLTEGIPAEIAAIQEQYEYYRNKLLSFPKLEA